MQNLLVFNTAQKTFFFFFFFFYFIMHIFLNEFQLWPLNKNDVWFNLESWLSFFVNGKPLKLVDHFIYLGRNISSTERNVNILRGKAWTDIDRLSL